MAFTFTDKAARDIVHDGLPAVFPAGSIIEWRTGAPPGPGAAPTGTVVASMVLPAGPWAAAAGRGVAKANTWEDVSADNNGIIGHFRLKTAGDTGAATQNEARIEGIASEAGGGGDAILDNADVNAGQDVIVNTFAVSVP